MFKLLTDMGKKKKIKIGLTMGIPSNIWSNGLDQNTVFLAKLLDKAGFDVSMMMKEHESSKGLKEFHGIKLAKYKKIRNVIFDFDVVLFVSGFVSGTVVEELKEKGTKTVMIDYGNYYQIFNEFMVKNPEGRSYSFNRYKQCDEVWVSPHFERNIPWYKTFITGNIDVCPYIWNPLFFDEKCKAIGGDPKWSPEKNVKDIAIHEPNINVIKTCIIPLSIAAAVNQKNPKLIDNVYTLNTEKLRESKNFEKYIRSLGLMKKGSFDNRKTTPFMVCKGIMGTSVFCHSFNGLNYLPMELLRLGYPVVHNSEYFKSAGYFYPEIDVGEGARQLELAITTHEDNIEEQLKLSKELIFKYSDENPDNIEGYKRLIEKLLDS